MSEIRYFKSACVNPFYNLALEQYLFEKKPYGDIYIYLWQNDKTVVIGRHQNIYDEINLNYMHRNNIKAVRRTTGGGAVYHDMGNLNYSFIVDSGGRDLDICRYILGSVLSEYGIDFQMGGRNDIYVNENKISGTAQYSENGKLLYHGTLLVNSDLNVLYKVLTRKTKIMESKAKKSVHRKVANISEIANMNINVGDVMNAFLEKIRFMGTNIILDTEEISKVHSIKEKYESYSWNYGFQPEYTYKKTCRFRGGTISISVKLEDGVIKEIKFEGDFFALKNVKELEDGLLGCSMENLADTLRYVSAGNYIKDISEKDIESLFSDLRSMEE